MPWIIAAVLASVGTITAGVWDLFKHASRDVMRLALAFEAVVLIAASTFAFLPAGAALAVFMAVPLVGFAVTWARLDAILARRLARIDEALADSQESPGGRLLALYDRVDELEGYAGGWTAAIMVCIMCLGFCIYGLEIANGLVVLLGASTVLFPFARAARHYLEDGELRHLLQRLSLEEAEAQPVRLPEGFPGGS